MISEITVTPIKQRVNDKTSGWSEPHAAVQVTVRDSDETLNGVELEAFIEQLRRAYAEAELFVNG